MAVSGLHGSLPSSPRVDRIALRDAQGTWLALEDVALDWSPLALLSGDGACAAPDRAPGSRSTRLPVGNPAAAAPAPAGSSFSLPVRADSDQVQVGRIDLAAAVAGAPAALSLDGSAHLASLQDGDADVLLRAADGSGTYHLRGHIDPAAIRATLHAGEAAHGLVARLATLPDLGALNVHAVAGRAVDRGGDHAGGHGGRAGRRRARHAGSARTAPPTLI